MNWEPMQLHKYWCDVVSLFYKADKSDSRIFNRLELVDGAIRLASRGTVAVVQPGGYQRVNYSLCCRGG